MSREPFSEAVDRLVFEALSGHRAPMFVAGAVRIDVARVEQYQQQRSRPCLSCGAHQYADGTLPCGH